MAKTRCGSREHLGFVGRYLFPLFDAAKAVATYTAIQQTAAATETMSERAAGLLSNVSVGSAVGVVGRRRPSQRVEGLERRVLHAVGLGRTALVHEPSRQRRPRSMIQQTIKFIGRCTSRQCGTTLYDSTDKEAFRVIHEPTMRDHAL
jgi:hypothetical protein